MCCKTMHTYHFNVNTYYMYDMHGRKKQSKNNMILIISDVCGCDNILMWWFLSFLLQNLCSCCQGEKWKINENWPQSGCTETLMEGLCALQGGCVIQSNTVYTCNAYNRQAWELTMYIFAKLRKDKCQFLLTSISVVYHSHISTYFISVYFSLPVYASIETELCCGFLYHWVVCLLLFSSEVWWLLWQFYLL